MTYKKVSRCNPFRMIFKSANERRLSRRSLKDNMLYCHHARNWLTKISPKFSNLVPGVMLALWPTVGRQERLCCTGTGFGRRVRNEIQSWKTMAVGGSSWGELVLRVLYVWTLHALLKFAILFRILEFLCTVRRLMNTIFFLAIFQS